LENNEKSEAGEKSKAGFWDCLVSVNSLDDQDDDDVCLCDPDPGKEAKHLPSAVHLFIIASVSPSTYYAYKAQHGSSVYHVCYWLSNAIV
jgi:hypothetical protein